MEKYHISDGKTETGPYTLEQLKEIPLNKNYLVWKQGMEKWLKITEIPELENLIYSVPPPISNQKNQKIKNYIIKHFLITFIILFLIGKYLYNIIWMYLMVNSTGGGVGEKTFMIVFLTIFITIIISIIIYNKNMKKLK